MRCKQHGDDAFLLSAGGDFGGAGAVRPPDAAIQALNNDWSSVNVNQHPYAAVVHMNVWFDLNGDGERQLSEWGFGTGYMVGPDVLLTAGHVIYNTNHNLGAGAIQAYLKYDPASSTNPYTGVSMMYYGIVNCDYAYLITPTNIGAQTGLFGIGKTNNLTNKAVTVSGYYEINEQYYQRKCSGTVTSQTTETTIKYNINTKDGQSGAPIFDSDNISWGIHTNGGNSLIHPCGSRFTSTLFDLISEKIYEGFDRYGYEY